MTAYDLKCAELHRAETRAELLHERLDHLLVHCYRWQLDNIANTHGRDIRAVLDTDRQLELDGRKITERGTHDRIEDQTDTHHQAPQDDPADA